MCEENAWDVRPGLLYQRFVRNADKASLAAHPLHFLTHFTTLRQLKIALQTPYTLFRFVLRCSQIIADDVPKWYPIFINFL